MIRVIGFQKILILIVLAAVLVLAALYNFYILKPSSILVERELRQNKSEISEVQTNMDNLVQGLAKFEGQKQKFETVRKYGFFDPQNRVQTKQRFNVMQKEAQLLSARYTIKPAQIEKNEKVAEAGYKIVNTEIDLSLEALEDGDIYNFLYLLNYGFPGQVSITSLDLSRDVEITQPLLRQIGVGEASGLVKATFRLNWRTMLPDETLSVSGQAEGGQ